MASTPPCLLAVGDGAGSYLGAAGAAVLHVCLEGCVPGARPVGHLPLAGSAWNEPLAGCKWETVPCHCALRKTGLLYTCYISNEH